ncbi:hypothetical protein J2795_004195 [Chryseobacterium bernardetii]|jgi:hypothetical protein|uniref:Uncharacterized protein n=2 Tax=Chryseobacterium TaxID=59732 RepID=A0A543EH22_9FLAO|nr:hypothetical protein [Chryseobacterium vietnamense]MDR6443445.1 hypothetical protein [Chryseobacterium bernardetii]TQM20890.1 hypothetical protein FB551_0567 [Chryseobacterium aquifrigidense]
MKQPINKEFIKTDMIQLLITFLTQAFQVNGIEIFLILLF